MKDSTSRKALCALASKVNFIWNYVNQVNKLAYKKYKQGERNGFLSAFDLHKLLSGSSKEVNLNAQTIQAIADQYVTSASSSGKLNKSGKSTRKAYLRWRSSKKHLGWIPFKSQGFKFNSNSVTYCSKNYKIYKNRNLPSDAIIKRGSFNQDIKGRWFVSITFETAAKVTHFNPNSSVGIDLGLKQLATLSDGSSFPRTNFTKKYEDKLALAQKTRKKNFTKSLHCKIKNSRKDHLHKITTRIAKQFATIYVGDVKSNNIIKLKNLAKSVYDASWFSFKNLLEYKAEKLGGFYKEVKESYSTQTCSNCLSRGGPRGLNGLGVREWACGSCNAFHNRDVNSAKNILRIGYDTL